jgi:hypothetical protein
MKGANLAEQLNVMQHGFDLSQLEDHVHLALPCA